MQTIKELLDRIRWDEEFARGEFELAFFDRVADRLIRLPLDDIVISPSDHFFFYYMDKDNIEHSVPLHRIKAVYKNGKCIWQREY